MDRLPFEPTPDEAADLEWFERWATSVTFRVASTVRNAPHAYWRAGGVPSYGKARDVIRRYGESRVWPRPGSHLVGTITPRTYRYLTVEGFEYWIGPEERT